MVKWIAAVSLLVAAVAAVPAAAARAGSPTVPDTLRVPDGNELLFTTFATGTQIYICQVQTEDPNSFAWRFKAPEAQLRDDLGEPVGIHFAGPSWQGNDGSTVVGEVLAREIGR